MERPFYLISNLDLEESMLQYLTDCPVSPTKCATLAQASFPSKLNEYNLMENITGNSAHEGRASNASKDKDVSRFASATLAEMSVDFVPTPLSYCPSPGSSDQSGMHQALDAERTIQELEALLAIHTYSRLPIASGFLNLHQIGDAWILPSPPRATRLASSLNTLQDASHENVCNSPFVNIPMSALQPQIGRSDSANMVPDMASHPIVHHRNLHDIAQAHTAPSLDIIALQPQLDSSATTRSDTYWDSTTGGSTVQHNSSGITPTLEKLEISFAPSSDCDDESQAVLDPRSNFGTPVRVRLSPRVTLVGPRPKTMSNRNMNLPVQGALSENPTLAFEAQKDRPSPQTILDWPAVSPRQRDPDVTNGLSGSYWDLSVQVACGPDALTPHNGSFWSIGQRRPKRKNVDESGRKQSKRLC
ncbi:hypothetical protein FIBSPDRAFT_932370 [Athelia psychrophila]|uniref:Uncharacterized protein n=1 Tax=Athelia psychrophila TaxID=1759441 RepID=A0A166IZN4_9AGAM|nr:hypothetical protein FIBSPDRAFT_932370 [Fibularhizoctonia sp. CBS 109695]